ncbi:TonB-dependent receptor [Pseudoxanthomonas indica]|uniref:TonB-dependent Receptor Plug Domain n=1 Tax=Pseudoxanthomonas indica TaxID=428993 RepID=A0A1T5KT56_9GAMM|nr:TonB-dependent receptor [Pseudoxanthomonas indica]GGD51426.1 Oar protein [Pseudoxanthomonas indica]SKC66964.1 TonB-dependent Receptor Plug Domain [Pseudoxanthomonas indica]
MKGRKFKKAALYVALGASLAAMAPMAMAQSSNGGVAGRATVGDSITVTSPATGLTRTVTVGSDGTYRLSQLPVGDYQLQVKRNGQDVGSAVGVTVSLGGTTTVNLGAEGGLVNLDALQVVGSRVVNRVDVRSVESATNIRRDEIARLPVDQSLASVALLAPGVVASGATFGGLTFGGSSVAENAVYINGLNVTDPYRRQGYSSVPFNFYEEFQIKTGGYSAEFGRSTGGVMNAVTRSGSNEFHAGAEITLEPGGWKAKKEDHFHRDGTLDERDRTSRDRSALYKTNVWASGPLVKDKLFFFAMYEKRDSRPKDIDEEKSFITKSDNDFWGAKFDWQITDNHLLEVLAFSDQSDLLTDTYDYDWDNARQGAWTGSGTSGSGGDNWSVTYTGQFGSNFTAKALYGVNKRSALQGTPLDGECNIVTTSGDFDSHFGEPDLATGCHPTDSSVSNRYDKREASRVDFEWSLGNHLLRFGADQEVMDSESETFYPGDGRSYQAQWIEGGSELPTGGIVPADGFIVDARRYVTGAPVTTKAQAIYLEDNWNITPNLLLNLGVRFDQFENKLASGATFAKADFSDMFSPRFGFSWDVKGDGTMKVFGNAGRYYIPLTNKLTDYFGGGTTDEHTYYAFEGWEERVHPVSGTSYLYPILGEQLGDVNTDGNAAAPSDVRTAVADNIKQVFQDEFILGFQQALNEAWSYGINATYRKVTRAVEDARINHVEGCDWYSGDWPIINPGETTRLWCPDTNNWVTFDSSKDGYRATGSGAIMGYKKPKRTYKAIELQVDRAWDDKWAFNASYLWSKSEGNIEGPVNSDTGYADTNLVQYYDHPAVNERYGVLFNDYRHQFKFRGSYKLNDMWSFGSTLSVRSGGPITAFGVVWPNDNRVAGGPGEFSGGGSGWLCLNQPVATCRDYSARQLTYSPRGAFGRMPWIYDLGASVVWTLPVEDVDLKARLSVYNLLNNQEVINVHSRYEAAPGARMDHFGEGTVWQAPRYLQLVVTYNF